MAFDWKALEQRQRAASDRHSLLLGVAWVAIGVLGLVVVLVTGRTHLLGTSVPWLVLGAVMLATSRARGRKRRQMPSGSGGA